MERIGLYLAGRECGEVTLRREGCCTEIRASMPDPGDGVYRAVLVGEYGQLSLGVMEPVRGCAALCRRPYSRDVDRLGRLVRGEAECTVFLGKGAAGWQKTADPAGLFSSVCIKERLRTSDGGWWRREGAFLCLALPMDSRKPFPLEHFFCLGNVCCIEGIRCVVYCFDRNEMPILQEK